MIAKRTGENEGEEDGETGDWRKVEWSTIKEMHVRLICYVGSVV